MKRFAWTWFVGLVIGAVLAFLLPGCAKLKPIVVYGCMGCKALLASGACVLTAAPSDQAVLVPKCGTGEVVVIENWNAVGKGAVPILGCEKER